MDVELHDWEVLDDSDSDRSIRYLDEIEPDSEREIRSDHFSLHSHTYSPNPVELVTTNQILDDSNNPSSIDPVSDINFSATVTTKPIVEFASAEGSESSDDGRYVDTESSNNELGVVEVESRQVACDQSLSDLGGIESKPGVYEQVDENLRASGEDKVVEARQEGSNEGVLDENVKPDGEGRNKVMVWWKLPLDLLKYCLFKASPVWSLSVAAAMMGAVILGRRLYKMKQKTRMLQLKVTVDDKKASQVMSRAARLNEAFSVVKRAPIIRPSLPAAGNAPWPMIALR